jgi:hypothetical protein
MNWDAAGFSARRRATLISIFRVALASVVFPGSRAIAADDTGFPDGFDATQAAPNSHRVLFENSFIRVLEVTVPPGTKEPMHHHRWPSIFLNWSTGGRTGHQRYYRADGSVRDTPSRETPVTGGTWRVTWMEPEPMHSIENVETVESAALLPKRPPTVRVELKFVQKFAAGYRELRPNETGNLEL